MPLANPIPQPVVFQDISVKHGLRIHFSQSCRKEGLRSFHVSVTGIHADDEIISISAAGLDKLISLTYENDSVLIRVFEEWNYPHTSEFLSSAAGVLIAFKAGAVLGHLITPFTGTTLQEEEELLRLYIASAEIKSALYSAPDEAKYDLASLYLTAEEAGSKKAYDYYLDMDLSDVVKQLLSPFFPPEAEDSTKKTLELIQGQLDELNTIRDEMGLPKGQDIMELLNFLPHSDPSSLYGTWDLDWHNEKAYENQTDERVVSVRLRILSIYKGTKFKTDVCISEVAWVDGQ